MNHLSYSPWTSTNNQLGQQLNLRPAFIRIVAFTFSVIAISTFLFAGSIAQADTLGLADIVGGGNGAGTGSDQGINVSNGLVAMAHAGGISSAVNVFFGSDNSLVDGVFTPDGGAGTTSIQVSSTGLTVTGVSDSTVSQTWDHIWNGTNLSTTYTNSFDSIIGVHANKGITFDLDAIELAHSGSITSFSTIAGNGNHSSASIDYYVFVDGVLGASASINGSGNSQDLGSIALGANDRFLTLINSSRGNHTGDWSNWVNPTLTFTSVPEPSSMAILGLGSLIWLTRRRATRN